MGYPGDQISVLAHEIGHALHFLSHPAGNGKSSKTKSDRKHSSGSALCAMGDGEDGAMSRMPLDVMEFPSQLMESLFYKQNVLEAT